MLGLLLNMTGSTHKETFLAYSYNHTSKGKFVTMVTIVTIMKKVTTARTGIRQI